MVRRRKQLKPSSAQAGVVKATLTGLLDTRPPLVNLPAEIQGIITSYLVQSRDLNHLCCTCKTLSAIVLPTLYQTIELKVPLRWTRLPSLENLLASSSEGLKYTRCLKIVANQYRENDAYRNLDSVHETDDEDVVENEHESEDEEESEVESKSGDSEEDENENSIFRPCNPDTSASNALNAFIRVLIMKLPRQQLHTFWWEHACSLDLQTISIVAKHQGASINTLSIRRNGDCEFTDLEHLAVGSLSTLSVAELGRNGVWPIHLLIKNFSSLRHVVLGSESLVAMPYALNGRVDVEEDRRVQLTDVLANYMNATAQILSGTSTPVVRLESLSLIGLDLLAFVKGSIEPVFDFNSLSVLILESCTGLEAAFPLLMGAGAGPGRRKAKSGLRLHSFIIRHEGTSNEFSPELETFLLSLKPLARLHVLLEGDYIDTVDLDKVLQVHGKSLHSLIWEERSGPRNALGEETTYMPEDHENLKLVAKHCPGLKALGIPLGWDDLSDESTHKQVASSFSRLSQLQTLNIRNFPKAGTSRFWLPDDYMMDGLATRLLDIITKKTSIKQASVLKTLAIGASTYGNVRMGMSHFKPTTVSTFLQLRIYHVNYDCRYRNSVSPKLHLIARGTPADARGDADNLDIFDLYWLDGFLRESH